MLNISEPGPPPALSIIFLERNWPRITKIAIGSTQEKMNETSGEACSMISLVNSAPEA